MAKAKNKSVFILSQPESASANEVVANAKAAGIKISNAYVYIVRSNARLKAKGRRPAVGSSLAGTVAATPAEREFRRLALDLGVKKAEAILFDTKKKVAAIAAGG